MNYTYYGIILTLSLFVGMLILIEVGRRLGTHRLRKDPKGARAGAELIEGAILALLGLMLAFTVSGAGARFDVRRHLVVEEANAIGTAYLRLDILPANAQPALRENFRRYLDARLEVYQKWPDITAVKEEMAKSAKLQEEIWRKAVSGVSANGAHPQAAVILLPALNEMIDITTTRTMMAQIHTPTIIFVMIFVLALVSALLTGYVMIGNKSRSWLHILSFTGIILITFYVIIDLEYPRIGFIREDAFDQVLIDLRDTMR